MLTPMLSVQIKLILAFVGYSLALIGYDSTTFAILMVLGPAPVLKR